MINTVQPVILCGGVGSRLWPLSRSGLPKQFLSLTDADSLFQLASKRLAALSNADVVVDAPVVVTGEDHRFIASEQLREIGIGSGLSILEPSGRNTAPALALAAFAALAQGADPILLVTPADQSIANQSAFADAMHSAIVEASANSIVILGIVPNKPESGYGYIQAKSVDNNAALDVQRFVEKPDVNTAQSYLDEGGYYWNAGIFVLKASVWLEALADFRPDIFIAAKAAWEERTMDMAMASHFVRPAKALFEAIPAESIDYAVMEKCPGSRFALKMVPLDAGWSDLGAWDAVWQATPRDENSNAHFGDVLCAGSRNTFVHASSRLVSLVGVENLVVVETPDAVLVANKSFSQDVKTIVNKLDQAQRPEHLLHRKVDRPWGWYDSLDQGERFKVKRIMVKPGACLSLQQHQHRAEHWIVVKGVAEVTRGADTFTLRENQSTYISIGELHRLRNPGDTDLEIIEVQSGAYLGEDDIVRFEDSYGRVAG